MSIIKCIYDGVGTPGVPCSFKGTEMMLGYHITQKHVPSKSTKKEEPEAKKAKRIEFKPPRFEEQENRDDLR